MNPFILSFLVRASALNFRQLNTSDNLGLLVGNFASKHKSTVYYLDQQIQDLFAISSFSWDKLPGSREKVVIKNFFFFQSNFANDSLSVYPSQSVKVSMAYIYLGEAQFHFHLYNGMVFICWDISYLLLSKTNLHYLRHSLWSKLNSDSGIWTLFILCWSLLIKLRTMSWDLFSLIWHMEFNLEWKQRNHLLQILNKPKVKADEAFLGWSMHPSYIWDNVACKVIWRLIHGHVTGWNLQGLL